MVLSYNPKMKSLADWCKKKNIPIGNFGESPDKMLTEEDFENLGDKNKEEPEPSVRKKRGRKSKQIVSKKKKA